MTHGQNPNRDQNQPKPIPSTGAPAPVREELQMLQSSVRGPVIQPGDPEYESSRGLFYGGIDRRPAAFVRVSNAADVAAMVNFARETGMELAVRSGGHSLLGHSLSEGGVVIDLCQMKGLQIDPVRRTAWAETGLTAGEYTSVADQHDLATGFGDTGSVGVGGITLGGGVGYLSRKHGLTIDNLLAAEIVTADGRIRVVDADHDPDLFWAIRGGGGNFGVATRFLYQLQPLGQVVGGMLFLPATPEVIAGFMDAAEAAPDELSTIANIMPAPPMPFLPPDLHGKMIVMAAMVYAGGVEDGLRAIEPIRKLANPLMDMLRPLRYPEMFPPEDDSYHPTAVTRNMFVDRVGRTEAETVLEMLQSSDAPFRVAQLRVLGGAVARVPEDATAYAHRKNKIMVNLAAFYTGAGDKPAREAWLDEFSAALDQGTTGSYVNFIGDEGEERVRAAYPGATLERLRQIKTRYDPTNLFHLNQNIQPYSPA